MTTKAYATPMPPPIRGKQLAALRAIASTPGGLRVGAYPSVMHLLAGMGLVEGRPASRTVHREGRAWFLTVEGRAGEGLWRRRVLMDWAGRL